MARDDAWMQRGACIDLDPELFFAKRNRNPQEVIRAKAVCKGCEVRQTCLAYALAHGIHYGIWGGKEERERKNIPTRLKKSARQWWFEHHPAAKRMSQFLGPYVGSTKRKGGEEK